MTVKPSCGRPSRRDSRASRHRVFPSAKSVEEDYIVSSTNIVYRVGQCDKKADEYRTATYSSAEFYTY